MVPLIARQSVIIKCNMKKSVLLGNYEFYYAAGLFQKFYGASLNADMSPQELLENILEQADKAAPKDEKEEYLVTMLKNYEAGVEQDAQTRLLFAWGEAEPDPWNTVTDYKPKEQIV